MSTPFMVNLGSKKNPSYVHPYSVLAITHYEEGGTVVLLNNEIGTQMHISDATPHTVAKRLMEAMQKLNETTPEWDSSAVHFTGVASEVRTT